MKLEQVIEVRLTRGPDGGTVKKRKGDRQMKRHLSTVILFSALVALMTVCGGETPPEEGNTALPSNESEAGSPTAQAKSSDLSEIGELAPDDILRFLFGTRAGNVNVLYIDVPQAIDALSQSGASAARTEFQELWDAWGFSKTLDIDIRDLDYIAFGENRGPDNDLFLFGGADFGSIRRILESVGWKEHEIGGAEAWTGDYNAMAFVGDALVLGTYDADDTFDTVLRFSGGYALAQDVLDGGTGSEILSVLTENKAARVAVLEYLSLVASGEYDGLADDSLLIEWMRLDLFQRYAGEDGAEQAFKDWKRRSWVRGSEDGVAKLDFARWLDGNSDALEDLAHWLAGDADTIEASIRRFTAEEDVVVVADQLVQIGEYEDLYEAVSAVARWLDGDDAALAHVWPAVAEEVRQTLDKFQSVTTLHRSLHDEAGSLWAKLPSEAILKQMNMDCTDHPYTLLNCERFAQALSRENDRQFRLVGILEYSNIEEAQEDLAELESRGIDDACEGTYEMDGTEISVNALCGIDALIDLVEVD